MNRIASIGCVIAVAVGVALSAHGKVICSGDSAAVRVNTSVPSTVDKALTIYASPWAGVCESVTVAIDGTIAFSTTNKAETAWCWQPLTLGNHTLICTFGTNVLTKTLKVTALDFYVTPAPNPPMAKDDNMSITPTTRNFAVGGGGNAIITSGSGTWTAAASDPWITLNAASGNVGYPVAYTVSANTNVEQRTGYVYVSGWVHTVTQDGVGGTISPGNATFEHQGGSNTIAVAAANKMVWQARPNVDWLSVTPTSGAGAGNVTYQVAPYNEVATRQGTLTVAGQTFTVFQYGRRMKLDPVSTTYNFETHVIPITVNALDITQWSVTPNNSWISIVDAGNGRGGDLVTIAIAENPSYKARTGTVTIGTETFTVTQQGRPTAALSFSVSPVATTASVNGANGMIAVTATPDLPWTATSGANWLTVYGATANGAGNGNVVYVASPNPTLFERTEKITVTPEVESGMAAKTHTVTQPAAESSLSLEGYEFVAAGESCSVDVAVADIVEWKVENTNDWLTVNGSPSRVGPGTVVLQAAANNTVYPRSGTVTIAGKNFSVSQKARGVELEYDTKLFGTDGGYESISIHPDGNSSWTAVASDPTWITIFQGDSGTGDGEILYIVSPYVGDGSARTGWITVGDRKVYITQRAYELSISPNGSVVKGNNGSGEFGVAADVGAVWNAIVTEPWIALVSGYDAGSGSGTVRFICEDNNTGKARVGKIVVAGEVYTVTQSARILVRVQATAGHGGSLTGSGTYDKGTTMTLTAMPDDGYRFVRWTGPVESTANPLTMDADELTGIKAEFEPLPVEFTSVKSTLDGVDFAWNTLAWATSYKMYRGTSDDFSAAELLTTLTTSCNGKYRDGTGERGTTYWYWVEAIGTEDDEVSAPATGMKKPIVNSPITYTNLRGTTHANPGTYVEGRALSFSHPSALTGYTFAGWTPSRITEDMTGAQTVRARWTANRYSIVYHANGGNGATRATAATYDAEAVVSASGFARTGHSFIGWATNALGEVVYAPGQPVTNLTAEADAEVGLYAVWAINRYTIVYNANGGSGTMSATAAAYDQEVRLSPNGFSLEGGVLLGWTTVPGGAVEYADGASVWNLTAEADDVVTLYAVWKRNPVFHVADGVLTGVDLNNTTEIVIPNGVKCIDDLAFLDCTLLEVVAIPDSVTSIGAYAFHGCTAMTDVYCYANPSTLTWGEYNHLDFKEDGSTEIHVRSTKFSAYVEKFGSKVNATFVGDLCEPTLTIGGGKTSMSRQYSCETKSDESFSIACKSFWAATASASWITITSGSSGRGNGKVKYALSENTGTSKREGTIKVRCGSITRTCTITQDKPLLIGGQTSISRAYENTAQPDCFFSVTCSQSPWTAVSSASWVTLHSDNTSGIGTAKLYYDVAANTSSSSRTATIEVTSRSLTRTCTITQKAAAATLTIGGGKTSMSRQYSCEPKTGESFSIACNGSWTATASDSWITITTGKSGSGNSTIKYSLSENAGSSKHEGAIKVKCGSITRTCTITQDKPLLIGGKTSMSRTYEDTAQPDCFFSVTCSQSPWTAASSASWVTLHSDSKSGTGSGKIYYDVSENPTMSQRSATIKVTSRGLTRTCTIKQNGE